MIVVFKQKINKEGHNPYFNRWFSAIQFEEKVQGAVFKSQSLF